MRKCLCRKRAVAPAEGTLLCGMRLILIGVIAWLAVSTVLSPGAVQAQETATGRLARIVVLAPKPAGRNSRSCSARANAPLRSAADARYSWYRLQLGGDTPQYLLMRAAPSWEAALALPEPFAHSAGTLVQRVTAELLHYRPTVSYRP